MLVEELFLLKNKKQQGQCESNFYSKIWQVINQLARVQYFYGLWSQDISCADWSSCWSWFTLRGPSEWRSCVSCMFTVSPRKCHKLKRGIYLQCLLLCKWLLPHLDYDGASQSVCQKPPRKWDTALNTLVFALSSHRQWLVPANLHGPALSGRDIPYPSLRAAKLPTRELTKLLLPGS